jgi:hypothetical protein
VTARDPGHLAYAAALNNHRGTLRGAERATDAIGCRYSLAVISDMDRLADGCLLLSRARALAGWVGAGRSVTPKGVLRPGDVPGGAAALEVEVPAKVRSAADVEAIHRPWVAAAAVGWLRVSANRSGADTSVGGELLDRWWAAVEAVMRAESHDDRVRGASVLCRSLLIALDAQPTPSPDDLSDAVDDLLDGAGPGDVTAVYSAFRRGVMPVDAGMELLSEIGAIDAAGSLTALGRWLRQRLEAEFPPPVSRDLSAAALLDRLALLPDDEVWRQAGRWLLDRDLRKAAEELLSAASVAGPAQRLVAVNVVAGLAESASVPAWQRALGDPMLAPHARLVLADIETDADDEVPEPSDADQRWLAVEYTLAALTTDSMDEAYHRLRERGGPDALTGGGHPGETELLAALAELIAAGGPPTPAYQLKIALTGIKPQVWRRIQLPATDTLNDLHHIIRIAFDWDDDHLHMFTVDGRHYADPFHHLDDSADESGARLGRILPKAGATMTYVYDLGDWWEHHITVERILDGGDPDATAVCVGGQGDAPVEDWFPDCGRDPTPFDIAEINRHLVGEEEPV